MDYFEPKTVNEALSLLAKYGAEAKVIAGGTDVMVDIKYKEEPSCLVNIKKIPGLGRILSVSTRPTFMTSDLTYAYSDIQDRVTIVGPMTHGDWHPDSPHAPDMFSPQYLLSGDYWYLEEMLFWAAWGAADSQGMSTTNPYGRGPTGAEGGINGSQVRGEGWKLRNRVNVASITPDDSPERHYFETLIDDAIAECGATSLRDLGRVMADVMPQVAGRADGSAVSQLVREKLA